jgi:hypothetical protein
MFFRASALLRATSLKCTRKKSLICAMRPTLEAVIVHMRRARDWPHTTGKRRSAVNIYLEESLIKAHQEAMVREVRANRLAKRLRGAGTPRLFGVSLLGLWQIVSRPAAGS